MTTPERYGRRKVSRMLAEWNAHRAAVASGDMAAIQATFDACVPWKPRPATGNRGKLICDSPGRLQPLAGPSLSIQVAVSW